MRLLPAYRWSVHFRGARLEAPPVSRPDELVPVDRRNDDRRRAVAGVTQQVELLVGAGREQTVPDDQRRGMRTRPEAEVLQPGIIRVLSDCGPGCRVHRDHCFSRLPRTGPAPAISTPIHREQPVAVRQDRGMTRSQRTRPDHRGTLRRPAVGEPCGVQHEVAIRSTPLPPALDSSFALRAQPTLCETEAQCRRCDGDGDHQRWLR